MNRYTKLFLATIIACTPVFTYGEGAVTQTKNEMTGAVQYQYFLMSSNDDQEFLRVICEPTGGIEYSFCRIKYRNLPEAGVSCHLDYNYKFDNEAIETKKFQYTQGLDYSQYQPLLQKLLQHDKLVIDTMPGISGMPTPVFDIKDFRIKYKQFSYQCKIGNSGTTSQEVDETPPKPVADLIKKADSLNDKCRDGSGDNPATMKACDDREAIVDLIKKKGWCYGRSDQIQAEKTWVKCEE
jgi:hypothetical protein